MIRNQALIIMINNDDDYTTTTTTTTTTTITTTTGLKITAGQRTMCGLIADLTSQTPVLPVIFGYKHFIFHT